MERAAEEGAGAAATPGGLAAASLEDRYALERGRVLLSGTQALVRLTLMQRRRDMAAGLNTAGFVSGYRGSPLAGLDREFQRAKRHLDAHHVVFRPGLNEDLAATAVWGSQQLGLFPGARYDGVFSMWYGKGPGLDRSLDAIRHAHAAGTPKRGGALLLVGDDHGAVSSTLPHQSEHNLISAMVPLLSPAGVGEFLDFGLLGFAMQVVAQLLLEVVAHAKASSEPVSSRRRRRAVLSRDFMVSTGIFKIRALSSTLRSR